jgi:thiamine monophosphate synthase
VVAIVDHTHLGGDARWHALAARLVAYAGQAPWLAVQLRLKAVPLADQVRLLDRLPEPVGAVLLNGAPELCGRIAGVHWPEQAIPASPTRTRPSMASVHDADGARRAQHAGASALLFGPVWAPGSKRAPARGERALAELCAVVPLPVFALGGVTEERVAAAVAAGAAGVATLSALREASQPVALLDALHAAVVRARSYEIRPTCSQ